VRSLATLAEKGKLKRRKYQDIEMAKVDLVAWEQTFRTKIGEIETPDPAHDLAHVERVVRTAKRLANIEGAQLEIVIPAAWLHDLAVTPKKYRDRPKLAAHSARAATEFLRISGYPRTLISGIHHCIVAHSFSAKIEPQTIEAKVVQDADRLDALGAIGIARCFAVSSMLRQKFYDWEDPFAVCRQPDDRRFALDHFAVKLLRVSSTLHTAAARAEGQRRTAFLRTFLRQLKHEIGSRQSLSARRKRSETM